MLRTFDKFGRGTLAALMAVALGGVQARGADGGKDPKDKKAGGKPGAEAPSEDDFPVAPDEVVVHKEFTAREVSRVCQRYEGQLIAYYGDVYKVEHCRRRLVNDNKTIYSMQREGHKVQDVSGDTVAALPEGDPVDEAMTMKDARTCTQLEGHYVTFSNVDVYFVDHCAKRMFPDWTTYIKHREKRGDKKGEILSLSWVEFAHLREGKQLPSVVDDLFAKMLTGEAGVEVIPVREACEGLEGRVASYYSRVYRVERCRKREIIEPDTYLMKQGVAKVKVVEMSSEQWLSLPEGAPVLERAEPARAEAGSKVPPSH